MLPNVTSNSSVLSWRRNVVIIIHHSLIAKTTIQYFFYFGIISARSGNICAVNFINASQFCEAVINTYTTT